MCVCGGLGARSGELRLDWHSARSKYGLHGMIESTQDTAVHQSHLKLTAQVEEE